MFKIFTSRSTLFWDKYFLVCVLSHSVVSDCVATLWTKSLPGSSVHGDLPGKNTGVGCSSRGSSWPRYSGLMCKHMHFSPSSSSHLLDKFYANFRLLWNSDMICVRDSISVSDLQHFHSQYCFPFCSKSRMWLEHNFLRLHPRTCLPPPTKSLLLWEWKWILPVCVSANISFTFKPWLYLIRTALFHHSPYTLVR